MLTFFFKKLKNRKDLNVLASEVASKWAKTKNLNPPTSTCKEKN